MSSPAITIISLPPKFKEILEKDEKFSLQVKNVIEPYSDILKLNGMEFFPEYTDHSINHIEEVLKTAEMLIPDNIFEKLTPEDIGVLVISVVLHDIGMHTSADMFKNMIGGAYNKGQIKDFDKDIWSKLWDGYKKDCLYWDSEKKENVFGNKDYEIKVPDLKDLQELNVYQKKFIGEFIRIYHCRIAHEISKLGYIGSKHIKNNCKESFKRYLDLAGLVARSHGINIRNKNIETYLKDKYIIQWKKPLKVHIVYLMALIRIADYLQIDKQRTNETGNNARTMYSPYSRQEHAVHKAISELEFSEEEEKIIVTADPENARTHVKIEKLVNDIQWEFDQTWAYLGEVYGNDFTLKYRRIEPNFIDEGGKDFVPQQFSYRFNDILAKKLVGPLYGDDPTFGVRELVQNAVDACRESKRRNSKKNPPHVVVELDTKKNIFTITDTGKGMTLEEIQKYFLTIGSSFNDNIDWKKWREDNNVYRSGRFGIGVLASFLLGDKICVETRSEETKIGYRFEAELGDKFIEIKKINKRTYGTKITIKCAPDCVERLKNEVRFAFLNLSHGSKVWYEWYIDENPKVIYYSDGIQIPQKKDKLDGFLELDYQSEKFGVIRWKPTTNNRFLYCNGFFITDRSNMSFSPFVRRYGLEYPSLQITDKYNKLPLNLLRTNIFPSVKFDFEDQLKKEVCKDILCQLFSRSSKNLENLISSQFKALNESGYILYNEYTKRILSAKKLKVVFIANGFFNCNGTKLIKTIIDMKEYSNCIFISCNYSDFDKNKIKAICYNESFYINNTVHGDPLPNMEGAYQTTYKNFNVQARDESDLIFFNPIIDKLSQMESKDKCIMQIIEIDKEKLIVDPDLEDIFKHYIGENILIPWDIKEREEKFPEIYNDKILAKRIKEYENIDILD